jgi:hypothetical protein
LKTLRIFIFSPVDVRAERVQAQDVLQRLQTTFRNFIKIESIFWEHEAMSASATFQPQMPPPSEADIVVCIFWAPIGMPLLDAGSRVPVGTQSKFENAYESHVIRGIPDLLVYRKTAFPTIENYEQLTEWQRQEKALDCFLENWRRDNEGAFKAGFNRFKTDQEFAAKFEQALEKILNEKLRT